MIETFTDFLLFKNRKWKLSHTSLIFPKKKKKDFIENKLSVNNDPNVLSTAF